MKHAHSLGVSNLCSSMTANELRQLFAGIGEVLNSRIRLDPVLLRSEGRAWIEMANVQSALKCIEKLNGRLVFGKTMRVEWARASA